MKKKKKQEGTDGLSGVWTRKVCVCVQQEFDEG